MGEKINQFVQLTLFQNKDPISSKTISQSDKTLARVAAVDRNIYALLQTGARKLKMLAPDLLLRIWKCEILRVTPL
jgi:hypothetical protein